MDEQPLRSQRALAKVARVRTALRHEEPDRVPVGEFYWGAFLNRWREDLGLPADADPYAHYDLDWVVQQPNLDPWIRSFEILRETDEEVVVKTGFGATIRKVFALPMPEMIAWELDTLEALEAAEFDPPDDPRRFFSAGDNQLAGVGDGFTRNSPAWVPTVKAQRESFAVFGSGIEVSECLTRLIGQANALLWMGMEPERMGKVVRRIGEFYVECARATVKAAEGLLDGFIVWGDVAYKRSLLFSPDYWREYYRPCVAGLAEAAHSHGLPVVYHSCGNVMAIVEDLIEAGVDCIHPFEVKAGQDARDVRKRFGHRVAICGNSDIRVWEAGDPAAIETEVVGKLNAAKGGGYLFQSDHSVPGTVSGHTYDDIMTLVREYGTYPLALGEYDEA
jgi:uroporphyrinogen decarboxylase